MCRLFRNIGLSLLACFVVSFAGSPCTCREYLDDPFFPTGDEAVYDPSVDVKQSRLEALKNYTSKDDTFQSDGNAVFDAKVIRRLNDDKYRHMRWMVKIENLLCPKHESSLSTKRSIILVSRPEDDTASVKLEIGKRYRIACYDFFRQSAGLRRIKGKRAVYDMTWNDLKLAACKIGSFSKELSIWNGSIIELPVCTKNR